MANNSQNKMLSNDRIPIFVGGELTPEVSPSQVGSVPTGPTSKTVYYRFVKELCSGSWAYTSVFAHY